MNLMSFLVGPSGKLSTMRLSVLLVILLVLGPRIVLAFKSGQYPALTAEEAGLIFAVLGVKAYQRGKEAQANGKENGQ